jgi:hypothetical protein
MHIDLLVRLKDEREPSISEQYSSTTQSGEPSEY